jgi:hypothetical protein
LIASASISSFIFREGPEVSEGPGYFAFDPTPTSNITPITTTDGINLTANYGIVYISGITAAKNDRRQDNHQQTGYNFYTLHYAFLRKASSTTPRST